MTEEQFKAWRKSMGWTQAFAAKRLGVSRRSVQLYEKGQASIPLTVELACWARKNGARVATEEASDPAGPTS